jgi:hypothetical protein
MDPRAEIEYLRGLIKCATNHPPIPPGIHVKAADKVPKALQRLYGIVYQLYAYEAVSTDFREPVNAVELGVFNYHSTVRRPVSLRDVLDGLVAGRYLSEDSAFKDLNLIWANCETFNGRASPFSKNAQACAEWIQRAHQEMTASLPAPQPRLEALVARLEANRSLDLLQKVRDTVEKEDPALLIDDSVEFEGMKMGLLTKIEKIVSDFERPLSARGTAQGSPDRRG